jgi:hypothetical protein
VAADRVELRIAAARRSEDFEMHCAQTNHWVRRGEQADNTPRTGIPRIFEFTQHCVHDRSSNLFYRKSQPRSTTPLRMAEPAQPSTANIAIASAIVAGVTGYMLGQAKSLGLFGGSPIFVPA